MRVVASNNTSVTRAPHSGQSERDNLPAPASLARAAAVARGADRVLTAVLYVAMAVILFVSGYAIWDTWRIYNDAGLDDSILKYKPELGADNSENFAELMAINPDVCAWITVDDTNIDYPVVQGEDNTHYLNTDVYGDYSLSGSVFLDYRNANDFTDPYSLIYGHHMDAGAMFGDLTNFRDADYFDEHQTATLFLPDATYRVELFACVSADAYDQEIFDPTSQDEGSLTAFVSRLKDEALCYRDVDVGSQDRIIALSTCSSAATNDRTVVFGKLVAQDVTVDANHVGNGD